MQPKILIVDDRDDNLFAMETILSQDGYKLIKANSGRSALKLLLKEYDYALILMDVKMPNLNGFETASLIYEREKLKHIPIIFITANNDDDYNVFTGYRYGAVDYIHKPINPDLLRAKVSVFVDLYRKNRMLLAQEQKLIAINKSLQLEINERKSSEEKVRSLNRQLLENIDHLEAANRDLDQFAFMASHDLQEPLRKIRMFSDRLLIRRGEAIDEDAKEDVTRIHKAAVRMQSLITAILTFSKMSLDKSALVDCDLNQLLQETLGDLDEAIRIKKADIQIKKLPTIKVDPALIKPLFNNLITNALKYSKNGDQPVIKIESEESSENLNGKNGKGPVKFCRIFVEDNGIGFDQKYAQDIFGMFKRLHGKDEFEGTGIGLALCKKIVEHHNGFISARSKPNEGATFTISLPVQ